MEITQIIEIFTVVGIIAGGLRAFFYVQAAQNESKNELMRLRLLVEGAEGDGGIKKRLNELEKNSGLVMELRNEIHLQNKKIDVVLQIMRAIATKQGIDIPFDL